MRKKSLMGSSKYEYEPRLLDEDIQNRNDFFDNIVKPETIKLIDEKGLKGAFYAVEKGGFWLPILRKNTGTFSLSHTGIIQFAHKIIHEVFININN